jgi:flagellar biosynthesis protein
MEKKAVVLKYQENLPAPLIIAKGKGELAKKILQIAKKNGIEISEDEKLIDHLFLFEVGSFIPEELYEIIAKLFAYIYKVQIEK